MKINGILRQLQGFGGEGRGPTMKIKGNQRKYSKTWEKQGWVNQGTT